MALLHHFLAKFYWVVHTLVALIYHFTILRMFFQVERPNALFCLSSCIEMELYLTNCLDSVVMI